MADAEDDWMGMEDDLFEDGHFRNAQDRVGALFDGPGWVGRPIYQLPSIPAFRAHWDAYLDEAARLESRLPNDWDLLALRQIGTGWSRSLRRVEEDPDWQFPWHDAPPGATRRELQDLAKERYGTIKSTISEMSAQLKRALEERRARFREEEAFKARGRALARAWGRGDPRR